MSIPLDRLYHYINDITQEIHKDYVNLYFFYPHGSRDIDNLTILKEPSEYEKFLCPEIYCNDQEPLNYNLYETSAERNMRGQPVTAEVREALKRKNIIFDKLNFRGQVITIWDQAILLHSEKRSTEVKRYQATQFIPAYYWSHAIIALDWFRYARHVSQQKQVCKTFLIYNRAWGGTREYRLRFAELLIHLNLQDRCQTSVNPVEPELGIHYETYRFDNPIWRPRTVLENFFPLNTAQSHYSADFDLLDYESTDIEVVLETLFDDSRLHLTEKALRPVACAQPFILAGTHGSLEYLRSYGFKTFGDVWDESYDLVEDPAERLIQIAKLMKQIANWDPWFKERKLDQAQAIADYNKKHFFSKEFFNSITVELKTNLTNALVELENTNTSSGFLHRNQVWISNPELVELSKNFKKSETREQMLILAQYYNRRHQSR